MGIATRQYTIIDGSLGIYSLLMIEPQFPFKNWIGYKTSPKNQNSFLLSICIPALIDKHNITRVNPIIKANIKYGCD